jgi:hypothetical protein
MTERFYGAYKMEKIGGFKLTNRGGFVCAGQVQYMNNEGYVTRTDRWRWLNLGESEMMTDLGRRGVPDSNPIQMYIAIRAGNDRTGGRYFQFDPSSRAYAEYRITGTTLNSAVHFDGISVGV